MAPQQVDNNVVVDAHRSSRYVDSSLEKATKIVDDDWRADSDDDELFADNDVINEADSLPPPDFLQQQQQRQRTSTIVQFAVDIRRHEVMNRSKYTKAELKKCFGALRKKSKR
jgi:hypothetical protein